MKKVLFVLSAIMMAFNASAISLYFAYEYNGTKLQFCAPDEEIATCQVIGGDVSTSDLKIPQIAKRLNGDEYEVVAIGSNAFKDCKSIISVETPPSIKEIGEYAFYGCNNLENVYISDLDAWCKIDFMNFASNPLGVARASHLFLNGEEIKQLQIPSSVTSIKAYTFSGCTELSTVNIFSSVTSIGPMAFASCYGLTSVNIPNSVTSIGEAAFAYCKGLPSVTIPNSVTSIGERAFNDCSSLTTIEIPNSVTSIGERAFASCTGLTSVTIPNSVTAIGGGAFRECTALAEVTLSDAISTIESSTFYKCSSLKSVVIPNSVTSIGSGAFEGCVALSSLSLGNSVTILQRASFNGCSSLTSVVIPNSVTDIRDGSFQGCTGLTSVTIGESVTKIGRSAFSGDTNISLVTSLNPTPPELHTLAFPDEVKSSAKLLVPEQAIAAYSQAEVWKEFKMIDVASVEDIIADSENAPMELYDLNGTLIYHGRIDGINLPSGIYILRHGKTVKKIMIK